MPECPYCGRWFKTKRGLKVHISKAHMTESIFGMKTIDPSTLDPFKAMERRMKRFQRRMKRRGVFL